MTRACLLALLSHWRRAPLQLFTLLAGLALATALWSGVQAINAEARASYDAAAATLGEGRFDQLVPRQGDGISQETYIALRLAGWQVSPVLEGPLRAGDVTLRVVGLDPMTTPSEVAPVGATRGRALGDFLSGLSGIATPATAKHLPDMTITTDADIAPKTLIVDIALAQTLLQRPNGISRLIILPEQPIDIAALADIAPDLRRAAAQDAGDLAQLTGSFHLNLTAFALLSFAVGIFIVHGAIGLAFEQRRAMVRTLRTLGVPLQRLIVLMVAELLVLSLIAGGIGVALGYVVASVLLPDVAATLDGLYGAQVAGSLQLRPSWWLSGLAISVFGAGFAAIGALIRIARMPILASAKPRAWAMAAGRGRQFQGLGAAALLLISGALVFVQGGLLVGFIQLGCLLIGAALALPLILDLLLRLGQSRARSALGEWFWADSRQQLPGLSLALMALLLAIAANIGVTTMVSSFRLTFVAFLDQRLASDLYVRVETPAQSARIEQFLITQADEVLPLLSIQKKLAGLQSELSGVRVGPTYQENWTFLAAIPAPWAAVADGSAVIVNEQLARRSDLWVGDVLDVGLAAPLPIAGVFGDYGNPVGKAMIAEPVFKRLHPDLIATRFSVSTQTPVALRAALIAEFDLAPDQITDQARIKEFSLEIFERTFTVTGALNVLTLAVAAFAILTSMMTLAAIRLPQLAPVWALGMTRGALGRIELLRAVLLALLTAVLALPLGLALAWVLLAVVNVEAFGWRLPMFLFPLAYARLVLFALIAAGLAALGPSLRLIRMPPGTLLKVFASER